MRAGFPHSEICGSKPICRLPAAYRRLSRPSSPVIAKASTTCTYSLDPITLPPAAFRATSIPGQSPPGHLKANRKFSRLCLHPHHLRGEDTMQYITQLALAALPAPAKQHARALARREQLYLLSRIVKEQPIDTSEEAPSNPATQSDKLLADSSRRSSLVEPIGIEPMTSCLQSRRSPS